MEREKRRVGKRPRWSEFIEKSKSKDRGPKILNAKDKRVYCSSSDREVLLNHIDIIVGSGCARGRSSLLRGVLSGCSSFTTAVVGTTPVIFHLLVQLLLSLARTGIGSAVGSFSLLGTVVAATTTSASAAAVGRALAGALPGNVTVDVVWGGLSDVAAMSTTATAASVAVLGAHATVVAGALYAVQKAGPRALCGLEGVTFTAAGDERKTNGLALSVGSVVLLNGEVCILQAGICDESNSLGASSAVVRDSKFRDGSNSAEEILFSEGVC